MYIFLMPLGCSTAGARRDPSSEVGDPTRVAEILQSSDCAEYLIYISNARDVHTLKVKGSASSIMRQETLGAFLKRLSAAAQPAGPPPMIIAEV